jgi:hypothetical protein
LHLGNALLTIPEMGIPFPGPLDCFAKIGISLWSMVGTGLAIRERRRVDR